jgi:uncharacterized protein (TIGR03067 family)
MLIGAGVAFLLVFAVALVVIVRQPAKERRVETPNGAVGGEPRNVSDYTAKSKAPIEPVVGPADGAPDVRPTATGKTGPSANPDHGTVRPSRVGDETRLQGEWVCTHEEAAGVAATPAELAAMGKTLTVKGKRFTINRIKDGVPGSYDGEFELNPSTTPKRFDFSSNGPPWFVGVYELSEDEFKVCYRWAGTPDEKKDRATDFKTSKGSARVLNTFKRVSPAPTRGWTPLFNGKDLDGWTAVGTSKGDWKVVDGSMCFVGGVDDKHTRHLVSSRADYSDIHIRFEVSINDGGHGHICFRATPKGDTVDGYVVQINSTHAFSDGKTGSLFALKGTRYGQYLSNVPKTATRPGVWVPMEIIARGNRIVITVEGQQVVDYTDPKNAYKVGSIILLQPTTKDKADIRFRKIEVK